MLAGRCDRRALLNAAPDIGHDSSATVRLAKRMARPPASHSPPLRSHRRRRAATPPLPSPSRRHRPSRRLCGPCRLGCPLFRGPRHRRRRRRPRRHRYRRLPPRHPLRHRHPPSLPPSLPASVLAPPPTHHHQPPRAPTRRPRAPTPPPSPTSPSRPPTPRPRLFIAPLGASWRRLPNRCGPTRPPGGATAATGRHSPSSAGRGLRRRAARGGQAACWRAALLVVILVPRRSPFGHFSGVRPQRGEKAARSARWRR